MKKKFFITSPAEGYAQIFIMGHESQSRFLEFCIIQYNSRKRDWWSHSFITHDKNLGIAFGGTGDVPCISLSMVLNGLAVARRIGVRFSWIFFPGKFYL